MKRFSFARVCGIFFAVIVLALIPARTSSAAMAAPAKVKNFHLVCKGNKAAILGWNKAKNASYYLVFSYDPVAGTYTRVAKTTELECQVKRLADGQTYHFVVQSVNSRKGRVKKSDYSAVLDVKGKAFSVSVKNRRWDVTAKATFVAKDLKTGKKVKIKKGTHGEVNGYHKKTPVVEFNNGLKIKTSRSKFKYGGLAISKSYKLYTKERAEAFVNYKGYSSKTKWLVWVNQYTCSVHVFKGSQRRWKRMRVMRCVIGERGRTSPGIFHMIRYSSAFGKRSIYFSWNRVKQWGLTIHRRTDQHTRGSYSDGCVRLGDSDLDYVLKNCPLGTTVVSF